MSAIQTLTNVSGLYALTADGQLGRYDATNTLVLDPALTRELQAHLQQFLVTYHNAADAGARRLGLLYRAPQRRPWGTDTLMLEEAAVRELYPVSGRVAELTAFQKKNREKSIYRGIELLLEYRLESLPEAPVYCPVLYDRGLTLDCYPAFSLGEASAGISVVEVLNIIADLPAGRRDLAPIRALMHNMAQHLIHKNLRREDRFSLLGNIAIEATSLDGAAEYFDVDKRSERTVTLSAADLAHRLASADHVQHGQRIDSVEQWLRHPHENPDPLRLCKFSQFKSLPARVLEVLANRSFIYTAPSGTRLLTRDMKDAWNMYLLEGSVSLEAADGGMLFIEGGTDKAESPIAFLKPRKYTVTAVTSVSFLWVHDALLQAVLSAVEPVVPVHK